MVCELGSGTGVCGLAAAALGAPRVVLTDLDAYLPLLRRNVDRNRRLFPSTSRVSVAAFHWGDSPEGLKAEAEAEGEQGVEPSFPFSVILVSECVSSRPPRSSPSGL